MLDGAAGANIAQAGLAELTSHQTGRFAQTRKPDEVKASVRGSQDVLLK